VSGKVAGLVLAAGAGSRLGRPKALLRLDNRTLAAHAADVLAESGCEPVIVVIGASADKVRACVFSDLAAAGRSALRPKLVINPDWDSGMGSSLIAGLQVLPEEAEAVVVILVDQPGITTAAVERLVARARPDALAAASYHGRRGHPILFGRGHWAGICASASGDSGARAYLKEHEVELVECADVASDDDIDTPEAAAAWGIE
jgi:nicotine blue oxidoreductase